MKEGTRNTLLGLFMILALSALGALAVMIGETPAWLGGAEWEMRIVGVRQLSPIAEGTEVHLNGVNIGRVAGLDFEDRNRPALGVYIITRIKRKYSVPSRSFAKIYSPMLGVGRGRIDIIPPDAPCPPLAEDSAVIEGQMASMVREVISEEMMTSFHRTVDQIGNFAEALTPVANDLHDLMELRRIEDVEVQEAAANLSTVIQRFDATLTNFNKLIGDEEAQANVKAVAANLREASERFMELAEHLKDESGRLSENLNQKLDDTDKRIETFLAAAVPVLENLDETSGHLERAAGDIAEGRGTLGLMLRDDRLYESLVESSERVNLLIATLQPLAEKIAGQERIPINVDTAVGNVKRDVPLTDE